MSLRKSGRIISGSKARNAGDYFESLLEFHCRSQKIALTKIPTGCRLAYVRGKLTPIVIPTPYDYALFKNGKSVCLDCKTIEEGNFTYSAVKQHQVDSLLEIERQNVPAGYLVYYRNINQVYFFLASTIKMLEPRESLKLSDGALIGSNTHLELGKLYEIYGN